jgi:hypothetical protein
MNTSGLPETPLRNVIRHELQAISPRLPGLRGRDASPSSMEGRGRRPPAATSSARIYQMSTLR